MYRDRVRVTVGCFWRGSTRRHEEHVTGPRPAQIGIMLLGTMVDNLVVGGPAFNSRQLHHGDIIVKVDGTPVTQSNIHEMMVGNDIPGTPVLVTITRGGPKVTAARRRSARRPHHRLNRTRPTPAPGRAPTSTFG